MPKAEKETPRELGSFRTCFALFLGQNDATKEWAVILKDVAANKQNAFSKSNLSQAMKEAHVRVRKRELENRRFPIPEPNKIISLENSVSRLVGPDGRKI